MSVRENLVEFNGLRLERVVEDDDTRVLEMECGIS